MDDNGGKLPDRIAFIADAHLGMPGDDPSRYNNLVSFLKYQRRKLSHLYIVGDLFDFWFEYSSVVPNIAPRVIFELYNLVQSGTHVTILGGNHDYWIGKYLRDDVGLDIETEHRSVEHQGLRIYIHHGDGLYPNDHGYRLLKKVLRNPVSIFFFGLLHPDLARGIAHLTSKTSRSYLAPPKHPDLYKSLFRGIAGKRLAEGFDVTVYGHSHVEHLERLDNGTLVLLGDWIRYNTYVILENGEFTFHNWKQPPEEQNG